MVVFGSGTLGMRGICEMKRELIFSVAFAATCLLTAAEPCAPGRYWMSDMDGSIAVGQWPTGGVGVRATEC